MTERPSIMVPDMCKMHQSLLVHQAQYTQDDAWRTLIVVAQIALFQASSADTHFHERVGSGLTRINEIGCLACFKPDAFGAIVEASKDKNDELGAIKRLGESWVKP